MIINNTHVQGIYNYVESLEYELGDFVIKDNCIYICTAKFPTNNINNTVSGQNPIEHPENFEVYLANKVASLEDYINYINGNSTEDKYISNYTLSAILQKQFFGLNESGIITESVLFDSDENIAIYSTNIAKALSTSDTDSSVLDRILNAPTLNNGVIKVSPTLPQVENVFLNSLSNSNYIILRQYTYDNIAEIYTDSNNISDSSSYLRYRVQELINPINGNSYCRYCIGKKLNEVDSITGDNLWEFSSTNISPWRSLLEVNKGTSESYSDRLTEMHTFYTAKLNNYTTELSQLRSLYRTAIIWSTSGTGTTSINNIKFEDLGILNSSSIINKTIPIQIIIGSVTISSITRLYTTTVDLAEAITISPETKIYYVSSDMNINISVSINTTEYKNSTLQVSLSGGLSNYYIKDISCRKKYE